jgi:ADP-heptose:LPS heptosyltransferase
MLQIDRWLGVPLCFAASCLKALLPVRKSVATVRSIAFVKLAEQGSTVLAHRALQSAVTRVGRENVFIIVFEDNRFIVDVLDVIPRENVITVRSDTLPGLVRSALAAIARLRSLKIDAIIDMEFFARSSALLTYLSGAPVRVGFHAYFGEGPYRGNLMTHRVRYNPHLHTTQIFALLVAAIGAPPEDFPRFDVKPETAGAQLPIFAPAPEEIAEVESLLKAHTGLPFTPPLILLNPNASDLIPMRRWSPDSYVHLARSLLDRFPEAHIAFTGRAQEGARIEPLVQEIASDRCFSLAGKTTLRQLLVLYGLAAVLVTNDSGPAHFASLTPIHSVTLFGPETPLLFSAANPRDTPLWAGIACSPCVSALNNRQSACRDNACMQRISVVEVFQAACVSYEKHQSMRAEERTVAGARAAA